MTKSFVEVSDIFWHIRIEYGKCLKTEKWQSPLLMLYGVFLLKYCMKRVKASDKMFGSVYSKINSQQTRMETYNLKQYYWKVCCSLDKLTKHSIWVIWSTLIRYVVQKLLWQHLNKIGITPNSYWRSAKNIQR